MTHSSFFGFSSDAFLDNGYELTAVEIDAVPARPVQRWREVATHIDVRLQKTDLSEQVE